MSITVKVGKGRGKRKHCNVSIAGTMTIYDAVADRRKLLDALDGAAEIEIDLSEVTEMDTAGVQLLAMIKREAIKAGKALHLVAHSQASLDVLDRYNLGGFFGDPVVIPRANRRAAPR
ncbi:MAG: hypothetical protein A2V79_01865 [Betaproteobacteria bacterium RBG_16_56_24]|nr:MAG: hypothetical protein A2V79_01865 [Betaproteobacteria bacterium RBG_16_56_24]